MHTKELTGYPSIDKPWLKYYSEEAINAPLPECTIYEYLWENNKDHLDDVALIYFGRKITYGELFENIDKAARAFVGIGMKQGDVCTVVTPSCVNSIVIFYALNKIGAISNYINIIASETEFQTYFSEARSEYVVTVDLFLEKTIQASKKVGVDKIITFSVSDYMPMMLKMGYKIRTKISNKENISNGKVIAWKDFLKRADSVKNINTSHDCNSTSIWGHTGGTTGVPKTVLLTDKAYNTVAMQYMKSMSYQRGQVFLNIIVPFVVYGMLTCMHMPLCLGLTVAIVPKFEAADWFQYFKKYRPMHIVGIPSYFSPMLEDRKLQSIDLSFIQTFAAGGDGLSEQLELNINKFLSDHGSRAKLLTGYGMTEVCSSAVTAFDNHLKIGSVGIPLVKNNIRIYDNDKKCECKYGETGEVLLSSPSLMIGYKDNEKETNELIMIETDGTKWVHTEDLGYVDEDGFLFLLGRMKRVMFVGPEGLAYKVFPKKIEDVIMQSPEVAEVCVVSGHDGKGFSPKAYVVLKNGITDSADDVTAKLTQLCLQKLPDYLRPYSYEYLAELPKTVVGKIDYKVLEKEAEKL